MLLSYNWNNKKDNPQFPILFIHSIDTDTHNEIQQKKGNAKECLRTLIKRIKIEKMY